MPYHNPATWLINEILSSTILNQVRDNLRYLKGLDEVVEYENAIRLANLTTTQRNALTPTNGQMIYNTTASRIEQYANGVWGAVGIIAGFQRFTSSGTWTKPAGVTWVYAQVIGGGAAGKSSSDSQAYAGGPGGLISEHLFQAGDLSGSVSVTIGSGGAAASPNNDTSGGMSAFGDLAAAGGFYPVVSSLDTGGSISLFSAARPGQGGQSRSTARGFGTPGIGGGSYTARLANGADSSIGTGAGGGGSNTNNAQAGNGGTPGGGGGAARTSGSTSRAGAGARGEVRVYGW